MAALGRKEKETAESSTVEDYYVLATDVAAGGGDGGRVPKGYVPLLLVGEEGDGAERVLVRVGALREPCMAALLDMAAQQFGYGHPGVLRIPCDARQFQRMVTDMCSKSKNKAR